MADILNKLNSANYVTVKVTDDPITNGNNLLAAYALAKNINPNGIVKSASNRLDIILPVAIYDLGIQSLTLDTQYIDLIGSTIDRNNHYIRSNVGVANRGVIRQTANDVKLFNLTIENSNVTYSLNYNNTDPGAYFPDPNLNLTYVENVLFTSNSSYVWSMRIRVEYSGIFTNCIGEDYSFGGNVGTASGNFTNCIGGIGSFGGDSGTASGIFKDCTGGGSSFGGNGGIASGNFTNCTGGDYSFGGNGGTASGIFTNCIGEDYSFGAGGGGTASGNFTNCTGGDFSFGGNVGTASGNFTNCIGEDYSFGANGGTASGNFTNCIGGIGSFNL